MRLDATSLGGIWVSAARTVTRAGVSGLQVPQGSNLRQAVTDKETVSGHGVRSPIYTAMDRWPWRVETCHH